MAGGIERQSVGRDKFSKIDEGQNDQIAGRQILLRGGPVRIFHQAIGGPGLFTPLVEQAFPDFGEPQAFRHGDRDGFVRERVLRPPDFADSSSSHPAAAKSPTANRAANGHHEQSAPRLRRVGRIY